MENKRLLTKDESESVASTLEVFYPKLVKNLKVAQDAKTLEELWTRPRKGNHLICKAKLALCRVDTLKEVGNFATPAKLTICLEKGDIVIAKEDFEALTQGKSLRPKWEIEK